VHLSSNATCLGFSRIQQQQPEKEIESRHARGALTSAGAAGMEDIEDGLHITHTHTHYRPSTCTGEMVRTCSQRVLNKFSMCSQRALNVFSLRRLGDSRLCKRSWVSKVKVFSNVTQREGTHVFSTCSQRVLNVFSCKMSSPRHSEKIVAFFSVAVSITTILHTCVREERTVLLASSFAGNARVGCEDFSHKPPSHELVSQNVPFCSQAVVQACPSNPIRTGLKKENIPGCHIQQSNTKLIQQRHEH
jgi:hypothetical protein